MLTCVSRFNNRFEIRVSGQLWSARQKNFRGIEIVHDPIIDEIRKVCDDIAKEGDDDVKALGRKLQKTQKASKVKVVSPLPNAVEENLPLKKTAKKWVYIIEPIPDLPELFFLLYNFS